MVRTEETRTTMIGHFLRIILLFAGAFPCEHAITQARAAADLIWLPKTT